MSIAENLEKILESKYGKDVRDAIHDSIEEINEIAVDSQTSAQHYAGVCEQIASTIEGSIGIDDDTISEGTTWSSQKISETSANVPIATTETAGKVKPDGTTISVDDDGTIKVIGGGGLHPQLIITSDAGSTITVSKGSETVEVTTVSSTEWICELPDFGAWTVKSTLEGVETSIVVYVDTVKVYSVTVSQFTATITATFPAGASVTVSSGSESYTGTSSPYTFTLHSAGTWTVSCTDDTATKSASVVISTDGQSENVAFTFATISVTVAEDLIGKTLTMSNGSVTYTKTSTSITSFVVADHGTWTGTIETNTASVVVSADTSYSMEITSYNFKRWLTLAGVTTTYATLAEALADQVAVRRAMTVHASCDYFLEWYENKPEMIDDFVSNDVAMKWIGLRDYICDKLMAISAVKTKMLASTYWERILKDHVPIMTSNTAPYGEASGSEAWSSNDLYAPYHVFDENTNSVRAPKSGLTQSYTIYKFVNPINVKKVSFILDTPSLMSGIYVLASVDGSTWESIMAITDLSSISTMTKTFQNIDSAKYYIYFKFIVNWKSAYAGTGGLRKIQYYGRSLNVSVPTMTSNTAPWGEVSGTATWSSDERFQHYQIFNPSSDGGQAPQQGLTISHTQYKFTNPIVCREVSLLVNTTNMTSIMIKASNNNSVWNTLKVISASAITSGTRYFTELDNTSPYLYYRLEVNWSSAYSGSGSINKAQLYGVDYSEREFASGSTMKYLYDHGVELETITTTSGTVTKEDGYFLVEDNSTSADAGASVNADFTNKSLIRTKASDIFVIGTGVRLQAEYGDNYSSATITTAMLPNDIYLDISSVNQSGTIQAMAGTSSSSGGKFSVAEMWLE